MNTVNSLRHCYYFNLLWKFSSMQFTACYADACSTGTPEISSLYKTAAERNQLPIQRPTTIAGKGR